MTTQPKRTDTKGRGKATPETVEQMAKRLWAEERFPVAPAALKRIVAYGVRCLREEIK